MDTQDFMERFNTEEQCREYLFKLRWPDGYRCPRCQCSEMWEITERKYKCKKCGYQTSVTAGTLFQDIHIPLTKLFRAAWLISTQPYNVTYSRIKRELELGSVRTARLLVNKLRQATPRFELTKLRGTVEIIRAGITIPPKGKQGVCIAVELRDKQPGAVRVGEVQYSMLSALDFIEYTIEKGSTIITDLPIHADNLKEHGYMRKIASFEYGYGNCNDILHDLENKLSRLSINEPLANFLDTYSMETNRTRTPMDFEELITRVVNTSPITRDQLSSGKKK